MTHDRLIAWTKTGSLRRKPPRGRSSLIGRTRLSFDSLEERTMLSITIAALGDSVSDEYQFYAPYRTAAENWPEIISTLRPTQVDMGAFSATGAGRGQTRNQGYSDDWALSGATASGYDVSNYGATFVNEYMGGYDAGGTMPPSNLPGLLNQPGGINNLDVVNILIGGNDYFRAVEDVASYAIQTGINTNTLSQILAYATTEFTQTNANIIQGITDAVTAIQAANPNTHIILDSTPNITFTPIYKNLVAALPAIDGISVGPIITSFITGQLQMLDYTGNTSGPIMPHYPSIQQLATSMNTGFVDANALVTQFVSNPTFNGVYINPDAAGPIYTDMFVGDGIHPGTIAQGKLTQAIVNQIDTWYPNAIPPITNAEILQLAQNVQPRTVETLTASPASVSPGQQVNFKVGIPSFPPNYETSLAPPPAPNPPMTPPPQLVSYPTATGTVTFIDTANRNQILSVQQLGPTGLATFSTTGLTPGIHQIIAVYGGNSVYPPAASATITVVVGATPTEAQVVNFVNGLPQAAVKEISKAQLRTWLDTTRDGVKPAVVDKAITRWVRLHTKTSAGATIAARSNAVRQEQSKRL